MVQRQGASSSLRPLLQLLTNTGTVSAGQMSDTGAAGEVGAAGAAGACGMAAGVPFPGAGGGAVASPPRVVTAQSGKEGDTTGACASATTGRKRAMRKNNRMGIRLVPCCAFVTRRAKDFHKELRVHLVGASLFAGRDASLTWLRYLPGATRKAQVAWLW